MSLAADDKKEISETQVADEATSDDVVVPIQYDITSFGADYDVEGLVKRLNRGDILIPPFQRNYVWRQIEASRFIESLLLGLPVPGVFLAREPDSNKLLVIDGQQRLKTLQFFYNGFFNPKDDEKKKLVFRLIKVQPKFEGRTYETLDQEDQVKLNDSLIHATIIKQEWPQDNDTSVYQIFDRLNSEGRRLTPQEIRTSIYHGPLLDLIKKLNEYPNWRSIYGAKSARLKDRELILRFLALYYYGEIYERPMNHFLNKFCNNRRNPDAEFLEACADLFQQTIDLVWKIAGAKAFRPERAINAAVFDSVMVGLAKRLKASPIEDVQKARDAYNELLADRDYLKLISQSTSDEKNVASRLKKAIEQFANV